MISFQLMLSYALLLYGRAHSSIKRYDLERLTRVNQILTNLKNKKHKYKEKLYRLHMLNLDHFTYWQRFKGLHSSCNTLVHDHAYTQTYTQMHTKNLESRNKPTS